MIHLWKRFLRKDHYTKLGSSGFTIVELIVVLGATALFVALILDYGMNYWQYTELLSANNDTFVSRLNAEDYMRDIVGTSDGLILQNSIPDPNANNPDPSAGANYWVTNHAIPGVISMPAKGSTTPLLYFRRFSLDPTNAVIMNGTVPYDDEYILYLDGTTQQLYVRTLANPSAPNNRLKTSCPPAIATASCPADRVIISNLSTVTATYYSRSGNTINWQSIFDTNTNTYAGPDFPSVEALQYVFHIASKPTFQKTNATINDTIVRIALRNT